MQTIYILGRFTGHPDEGFECMMKCDISECFKKVQQFRANWSGSWIFKVTTHPPEELIK